MYDKFNRRINYLRISITDRCNLRCVYCMPPEGVKSIPHEKILRYNEIVEVVREAVKLGIDKVRITGGEPLVRRGAVNLVAMIAEIDGIKDLAMTTNGILLDRFAKPLAGAGLHRVNTSLDTLNPERYKAITRRGNLSDVLRGIEAAKKAGLNPIKINCVIKNNHNEPDAREVARFCEKNDLNIRFIRQMDLDKGEFWQVEGGTGGACKICNRLRLTSDGNIKPCLFSDLAYNVRELGAKNALLMAIKNKPKSGTVSHRNKFSNIGG